MPRFTAPHDTSRAGFDGPSNRVRVRVGAEGEDEPELPCCRWPVKREEVALGSGPISGSDSGVGSDVISGCCSASGSGSGSGGARASAQVLVRA